MPFLAILTIGLSLHAEPGGTLIFSDDFNRVEATPDKEDLGNGWTTNSAWRAPGKKQAALKDGALQAGTDPTASHALVLFHKAPLRDGTVELKFQLDASESLSLEFADPECKTVHAGHLCQVRVSAGQLMLTDLKTGVMDLKIQARRNAGEKSPELNALIKSKSKSFPLSMKADQWHTLSLTAKGDTLSALIDGNDIGSFSSEGIAHPSKAEIRINVGKLALIDDVKIWKLSDP